VAAPARDARPLLLLTQVPLKVISIETGQMLREFKQLVKRGEPIVVIEQFNQKLLLKQVRAKPVSPSAPMRIYASRCCRAPPLRPAAILFWLKRQNWTILTVPVIDCALPPAKGSATVCNDL